VLLIKTKGEKLFIRRLPDSFGIDNSAQAIHFEKWAQIA
jgi:hypothetical protein